MSVIRKVVVVVTCPSCHGRTLDDDGSECPVCHGSGEAESLVTLAQLADALTELADEFEPPDIPGVTSIVAGDLFQPSPEFRAAWGGTEIVGDDEG